MSRYLPDRYEPMPDEFLRSGATLPDVVRRISRNQNWIWANHGAVFAACGHEPSTAQTPSITGGGGSVVASYFAAPLRSATGSGNVRVRAIVAVTGTLTTIQGYVNLWQLLPGESAVSVARTHVDSGSCVGSGEYTVSFTARVVCGQDPARFAIGISTASSNTAILTLLSATVTWDPNPTIIGGETVADPWFAISQSFVAPDRALSAALLRAVSNRTLRLMAENPRPLFSHSYLWPRLSLTASSVSSQRLAVYSLRHDGLTGTQRIRMSLRLIVTGQATSPWVDVIANGVGIGSFVLTGATPTLVNGAYVAEAEANLSVPGSIPSGDVKLEVRVGCLSTSAPNVNYTLNVGITLASCTVWQDARTATDLGLPGSDTVPTAYVPLDDAACASGRSIVAQDNLFGARAGMYYLVKNMIWLAANRTAHVLIADWLHRTQSAGWSGAGDGYYRNQTLVSTNGQQYPAGGDVVPWTSAANPTNAATVASGGQHYPGIVLARHDCRPLNGGRVGVLARPEILAMPGSSPTNETFTALWADIGAVGSGANLGTVSTAPDNVVGGFLRLPTGSVKPTAGQDLRIRGTMQNDMSDSDGRIIALHSLYAYEEPLTQANLDALP
jgi:hypothetical protein